MSKRLNLLNSIKSKKQLDKSDFAQIDYINLHAHSTYSTQDGVGQVASHFTETIEKGHKGCACTDHGSYASFIDLYNLKDNSAGNKKVKELFKDRNISEHPVVMGAELYIIDDRHVDPLVNAASSEDKALIRSILKKMEKNPKWAAPFGKEVKKSVVSIQNDENKSLKENTSIGAELLKNLDKLTREELMSKIDEFITATLRNKSYKYNHITLLVKSPKGHENLCYLTSIGSLPENFYTRPRIRLSDLFKNKEGIIATSGCFVGMIPQAIHKNTGEDKELVELFKNEFGDDFYLEMHITDISHVWNPVTKSFEKQPEGNPQKSVNDRLLELAKEFDMENKIYITQDSHMPKKEDKAIQDIIILNDPGNKSGWHFYNAYYIQSIEEMYYTMKENYPEYTNEQFVKWCFNSMEVLEKCRNVVLDTSLKFLAPDYENHPLNNPIRIKDEFLESLKVKGLIKDFIDKVIVRDQLRKVLIDSKDIIAFEIDGNTITINRSEVIDKEATKAASDTIESIEKELNEILKYPEYYVQKTALFVERELDLKTLLKVSVHLKKIDLHDKARRERFFSELDIIQFNGMLPLSDYFMTFEQISSFVIEADEFKGPGRGSAAGCIVSYAIDVTDIDPDKYDLLMERFLQPERIGFIEYSHSISPLIYNRDEVSSSLFKAHLDDWKEFKALLGDNINDPSLKDEIYFLERNLFIVSYLVGLLRDGHKNLKNENNSKVCELIGLCIPPEGKLKMTDRSMPDIDYDSSCRDLICEFLIRLHGREKVAYIGTYSALKPKSAIKEVLRIRKIDGKLLSHHDVNALTKEFDKIKLSEEDNSKGELYVFRKVIEENSDFRAFFEKNPTIKEDVENILGTYKSMGIHAAGLILSPIRIDRVLPCTYDKTKQAYVSQLSKDEAEQLGLIKLDMLGISTGEDIIDCNRRIRRRHSKDYQGKWEQIIDNLPENVGQGFRRANTVSVFQFNTPTAVSGLKGITKFEDPLRTGAVFTSAWRPGPMNMGMHLALARRNNGTEEVNYLHPMLEPILKDTFGVLIYQEQVMKISQVMGGFTKFEADKIRSAMGKKKFDIIEKYEKKFVDFAVNEKEIPKKIAQEIWNQMAQFAEYGFNKSHAISYAALSNICMYFKENYPKEWIASVFARASRKNSDKDKQNYKRFYREWKNYLKSPSVKNSTYDYDIKGEYIYMPLYSIKRVGQDVANDIIAAGPYNSLEEFFYKLKAIGRENKTLVEGLVYAGALDEFAPNTAMVKRFLKGEKDLDMDILNQVKEMGLMKNSTGFGEIDLTQLTEIQDLIEFQIGDIKELSEKVREFIKSSGLEEYRPNRFDFRKYALASFYLKFKEVKLKKPAKVLLEKYNLYTPENLYHVYSKGIGQIEGVKQDKDFSKLVAKSKNGQTKDVKRHLTPKEENEAIKVVEEIYKKTNKHLLLEELDTLNFTSFDFNAIFEEEIAKASKINPGKILTPKDIEEYASNVSFKLDSLKGLMSSYARKDAQDIELIQYARLATGIIKQMEGLFGEYQARAFKDEVVRVVELTSKTAIKNKLAIQLAAMTNGTKISLNDQIMPLSIKSILNRSELNLIRIVTGFKNELETVNERRAIYLNIPGAVRFFFFLEMMNNQQFAQFIEKTPEMKFLRLLFQSICEKLGDKNVNKDMVKDLLGKLSYNPEFITNLFAGLESNEIIENEKGKIMNLVLNKEETSLLDKNCSIAATVFKPEKKYFLKEVGKGHKAQKLMKLHLVNEEHQVDLTVFRADQEKVSRNSKSVGLIEQIKDFTPAIIQAKIRVNLHRDNETSLIYNGGPLSFVFLEDKINKI